MLFPRHSAKGATTEDRVSLIGWGDIRNVTPLNAADIIGQAPSVGHAQKNLNRMLAAWYAGALETEDLEASLLGWINHVRFANTLGLRKKIIGRVSLNYRKRLEK